MNATRFPRRRQSGSAVVEMAIIAPIAFLLIIGVIEFSIVFFSTLNMQYALREGARYAVTGRNNLDPNTSMQERTAAIIQSMKNNSMGMYDSLNPKFTVNGATYDSTTGYSSNMFGSAGEIVVIRMDCTWKLATPLVSSLFPNGEYKFSVATTMQNENFGGL